MSTVKNAIIGLLLLVLVITFPVTVYFGKSYFALSTQVKMLTKNQHQLNKIGVDNIDKFSDALDFLSQQFLNNRYILNNTDESELINVEYICKQKNGINCVVNHGGKIEFIGETTCDH